MVAERVLQRRWPSRGVDHAGMDRLATGHFASPDCPASLPSLDGGRLDAWSSCEGGRLDAWSSCDGGRLDAWSSCDGGRLDAWSLCDESGNERRSRNSVAPREQVTGHVDQPAAQERIGQSIDRDLLEAIQGEGLRGNHGQG